MTDDFDDINLFDMDFLDYDSHDIDSDDITPDARAILMRNKIRVSRMRIKAREKNAIKEDELAKIFPELPPPGTTLHVVSSGNFDFWIFIPHILKMTGDLDEVYLSTWTMSRNHVLDMLDLLDQNRFKKFAVLTGIYFKQKETSVYAQLVEGLMRRKHRWVGFRNHAKVTLMQNADHSIVIEGSANMTANPRVEQFVVTDSIELYEFHKEWMEEMLEAHKDQE